MSEASYRDAVATLLIERGATQAWLNEQSGVGVSTISRFLSGKQDLTVSDFVSISRALGREPGDMLPRSDSDPALGLMAPLLDAMRGLSREEKGRMVGVLAAQVGLMRGWSEPSGSRHDKPINLNNGGDEPNNLDIEPPDLRDPQRPR